MGIPKGHFFDVEEMHIADYEGNILSGRHAVSRGKNRKPPSNDCQIGIRQGFRQGVQAAFEALNADSSKVQIVMAKHFTTWEEVMVFELSPEEKT